MPGGHRLVLSRAREMPPHNPGMGIDTGNRRETAMALWVRARFRDVTPPPL